MMLEFMLDVYICPDSWESVLTFPKAIMLCSPLTREYLINYARPLIYTTFMSYPSLVAIRTVYDLMIVGKTVAVSMATPHTLSPPILYIRHLLTPLPARYS